MTGPSYLDAGVSAPVRDTERRQGWEDRGRADTQRRFMGVPRVSAVYREIRDTFSPDGDQQSSETGPVGDTTFPYMIGVRPEIASALKAGFGCGRERS